MTICLMTDDVVDILKLSASIKEHEGCRLLPYTDTTGHLTIGWGTNLDAGITLDEANYLLDGRVKKAISEAESQIWWEHVKDNDPRARCVVECIFNLGINGFNLFTKTIEAISVGDFDTASYELLNSLWAKQVGKRAERLAAMMKTGEDFSTSS